MKRLPRRLARIRFPRLAGEDGELQLATPGLDLRGVSIAALVTAFTVEAFRVAVDVGRCSARLAAQETVLLTHCHADHIAGLIAWLSAHTRRHRELPTRVVLPQQRREALLAALEIWPDLDGVRRRIDLNETLISAAPGTTFELRGGTATALAVHHNTTALGWAITPAGADRPSIVFAGDGTIEPFRNDPGLLDAEIAVVDCSFIEPGTRVAAHLGGHGHLQDWLELLPELQCDTLVLAHLPPEATVDTVLARLPEDCPGTAAVVPWIADVRRRSHR